MFHVKHGRVRHRTNYGSFRRPFSKGRGFSGQSPETLAAASGTLPLIPAKAGINQNKQKSASADAQSPHAQSAFIRPDPPDRVFFLKSPHFPPRHPPFWFPFR